MANDFEHMEEVLRQHGIHDVRMEIHMAAWLHVRESDADFVDAILHLDAKSRGARYVPVWRGLGSVSVDPPMARHRLCALLAKHRIPFSFNAHSGAPVRFFYTLEKDRRRTVAALRRIGHAK